MNKADQKRTWIAIFDDVCRILNYKYFLEGLFLILSACLSLVVSFRGSGNPWYIQGPYFLLFLLVLVVFLRVRYLEDKDDSALKSELNRLNIDLKAKKDLLTELENEKAEAEQKVTFLTDSLKDIIHKRLHDIHHELDGITLNTDKFARKTTRVSLFIPDYEGEIVESFNLVARKCSNPKLETVRAERSNYGADKGVVAACWENGWICDTQIPSPSNELYNDYHLKTYNYDMAKQRTRLKAQFFACYRLEDQDDKKRVGLLLFECAAKPDYNKQRIEPRVKATMASFEPWFASLLNRCGDDLPRLCQSSEEGF